MSNPLKVGDRVTFDGHSGEVESVLKNGKVWIKWDDGFNDSSPRDPEDFEDEGDEEG